MHEERERERERETERERGYIKHDILCHPCKQCVYACRVLFVCSFRFVCENYWIHLGGLTLGYLCVYVIYIVYVYVTRMAVDH